MKVRFSALVLCWASVFCKSAHTSAYLTGLLMVVFAAPNIASESVDNYAGSLRAGEETSNRDALTSAAEPESFCERLPRPAWAAIDRKSAGEGWFEVAQIEPDVWAIYEPFQWQEVISYLILGTESALLFDTGNGIGDIRSVVEAITGKPVRVLNSHSHYDHVGGNHLFNEILSPGTNFSQGMSAGLPHTEIADEVSDAALCRSLPDGVLAADHRIRPYTITRRVRDGELIDLGGRQLEVILLPGHTPDSLGLLDRERGFFWPGDSFYEGPIWLFMPETDLAAYRQSVRRMADLASSLMAVFPSHNTPRAAPRRLTELSDALERVLAGTASGVPIDNDRIEFGFSSFSLLIAKQQLGTTDVN